MSRDTTCSHCHCPLSQHQHGHLIDGACACGACEEYIPPETTPLLQQGQGRPTNPRGPYVQTLTGRHWYFTNPTAEDVEIGDLQALARVTRYGGHTGQGCDFYSVAEHSVRVARLFRLADPRLCLAALLHDGGEAYPPGDVLGPVVRHLEKEQARTGVRNAVLEMRDRAQRAVVERFGVADVFEDPDAARAILAADRTLLATERRDLVAQGPVDWGPMPAPLPEVITPWPAALAWERFRAELVFLLGEIGQWTDGRACEAYVSARQP